jgi:hypothetical protein
LLSPHNYFNGDIPRENAPSSLPGSLLRRRPWQPSWSLRPRWENGPKGLQTFRAYRIGKNRPSTVKVLHARRNPVHLHGGSLQIDFHSKTTLGCR